MKLPPEAIGPAKVLEWITQAHRALEAAERLTTDPHIRDQLRDALRELKPATARAREIILTQYPQAHADQRALFDPEQE